MKYDILIALATFLLILISSFAMYLPLVALIKNRVIGLKYAIPFSISLEIIIGYIFYCTSTVKYFPISYLIVTILVNIWAYYKLRPITFEKFKVSWTIIIAVIITLMAVVYSRYYDGFKFIGPGSNDTYSHLVFIKNLINFGYLGNGFYAPGFHLFLMPVAKLIPLSLIYRFAGPAIGLVSVISLILFIRDYLKNKILLIFLLGLLVLPIYNQFTLQTIGFFSSSLTFIYFASFIFLTSDKDIEQRKLNLVLFLIFAVALALTVPYLFVALIPAFLIVFSIVLIFKKTFHQGYPRYLLMINLILILGLFVSFGHILLQSKLLNRFSRFPSIQISSGEAATSNYEVANNLHLPGLIANNLFLKPIVGTGYDLLKIKNIRPANSVLGLGSYIWIGFSFFLIIYSWRKKNSVLLTVAILSVFFGLCTQTGFLEMSNYRGRSGWYLLLLSIFGLVLFADQIYSKKMSHWFLVGGIILSTTGFFFPPKFYRSYYDEEFKITRQIVKNNPKKNITLITSNHQLSMVGENVVTQGLVPENLTSDNAFLIIDKEIICPDPVLSQGAVSTDKNFIEYNKQFQAQEKILKNNIAKIELDKNFQNYHTFFENTDFIIYSNTKI